MPNEFDKLRRLIRILIFLLVIFVLLLLANLVHSRVDPNSTSFPAVGPRGEKGETAFVDYDRIALLINERLSALPQPKNGENGVDGRDGKDGKDGANGKDGRDGINGSDGIGADGRTPEFQVNTVTGELQVRYPPDRLWMVVPSSCLNVSLCTEEAP